MKTAFISSAVVLKTDEGILSSALVWPLSFWLFQTVRRSEPFTSNEFPNVE